MEYHFHVYCTDPNKVHKVLVVFTGKDGYLVAQLHLNPYQKNRVLVELQDFSCNSKSTFVYIDGKASGQDVSNLTPWLECCRAELPEHLRDLL
jgi:hypothetical protein